MAGLEAALRLVTQKQEVSYGPSFPRYVRLLSLCHSGGRVMGTAGWNDISYEIGDRRVHGLYRVEHGIITVIHDGREKATQVGDMPPETLARQLLRELAR